MACFLVAITSVAWAAGVRVTAVDPSTHRVGLYGKLEVDLAVEGTWDNPYDPTQIDVVAEIETPTGRRMSVPAFYSARHAPRILSPAEQRQRLELFKIYINEKDWHGASDTTFYIDDVRLVSSATGEALVLDDVETDNPLRTTLTWCSPRRARFPVPRSRYSPSRAMGP